MKQDFSLFLLLNNNNSSGSDITPITVELLDNDGDFLLDNDGSQLIDNL